MKKRFYLIPAIVIILIILAAIIFFFAFNPLSSKEVTQIQSANSGTLAKVTESNLPQYLMSLSIIQDLPSSTRIELKTTDDTYKIIGQTISQGTLTSPDIIISIPSSYIPQLPGNFCGTLQKAITNGDVSFQLEISKFDAGIKYHSLYPYKSCLGF